MLSIILRILPYVIIAGIAIAALIYIQDTSYTKGFKAAEAEYQQKLVEIQHAADEQFAKQLKINEDALKEVQDQLLKSASDNQQLEDALNQETQDATKQTTGPTACLDAERVRRLNAIGNYSEKDSAVPGPSATPSPVR